MANDEMVVGTAAAINDAAGEFGKHAEAVAQLAERSMVGQHIDTTDPALNSMITGVVGQLAGSAAGFRKALQSNQDGLGKVANGFAQLGDAVQWPAEDA